MLEHAHLGPQQSIDVFWRSNHRELCRIQGNDALPEGDRSLDLQCLDFAEALDLLKIGEGGPRDTVEPIKRGEKLVGNVDNILKLGAGP